MLCKNCVAKVQGGCFISKKKAVMCTRSEEEIRKARDIILKSYKLDELAREYIVDRNNDARERWWEKLREVCE